MLHGRTNDVILKVSKLYGERCSGTNYVETLIENNFPDLESRRRYNWEKHNYLNPPFVHDTMVGVMVTRDAFDWLRSFHRSLHQVAYWFQKVDFSGFLRHEWSGIFNGQLIEKQGKLNIRFKELMYERHPMTCARISNVVEMRNLKLASQLKVRNLYENWIVVRFEEARDDPERFLQTLADTFGWARAKTFQPVTQDVSNFSLPNDAQGKGRLKPYADFSDEDRAFVLDALVLEQEKLLGYDYKAHA
jgi:hypothetical protein